MSEEGDCEAPTETPADVTPQWYLHETRVRLLSDQYRQMGIMCLTVASMCLCLLFFFVCPRCLFGMLILSMCLCPFIHPMNFPLWMALILLTVSGWSFTAGALSVSWKSQSL